MSFSIRNLCNEFIHLPIYSTPPYEPICINIHASSPNCVASFMLAIIHCVWVRRFTACTVVYVRVCVNWRLSTPDVLLSEFWPESSVSRAIVCAVAMWPGVALVPRDSTGRVAKIEKIAKKNQVLTRTTANRFGRVCARYESYLFTPFQQRLLYATIIRRLAFEVVLNVYFRSSHCFARKRNVPQCCLGRFENAIGIDF